METVKDVCEKTFEELKGNLMITPIGDLKQESGVPLVDIRMMRKDGEKADKE